MNRKRLYENPEIALIKIFDEDIITSSDNIIREDLGENDGDWTQGD